MEEENRIKEQVLAILVFSLQFFTAKEAHLSTSKHRFRWSLAASSLIFVSQANHSPSMAMRNYFAKMFLRKVATRVVAKKMVCWLRKSFRRLTTEGAYASCVDAVNAGGGYGGVVRVPENFEIYSRI